MSEAYELVKFVDGSFELEVNVSPEEDTVWLTKKDLSLLFNRERTVISRHISNIFSDGECNRESNVRFMHVANSDKPVEAYNLDVVIAVGYRVKSLRGVIFRKWATSVLKQYMLKGFAVEPSCSPLPQATGSPGRRSVTSMPSTRHWRCMSPMSSMTGS